MKYSEEFFIDNNPLPLPDAEVELSYQDLDSSDSGRDESGFMHRVRIRTRVATWGFSYFALSLEAFHYIESILADKPTFTFTYPGSDGRRKTCQAYCAKTSLVYQNARLGLYRNYKFNIIEC